MALKPVLASICGVFALLSLSIPPASATTPIARTFVSNSGNDGNSCAADSPCLTLNGAYTKTLAGGEINILNGGDYGALTIAKSITIRGQGNVLGITNGAHAISVAAGSTDVVNLVGLDILGTNSDEGILITSGAIVSIVDCHFRDMHAAIYVGPTSSNIFLSVKDSLLQNNLYGVYVESAGFIVKALVDNIAVFGNGSNLGAGISGNGQHVSVVVNNSTITDNGVGLSAFGEASLFTYGNNRVNFNDNNGGPNQPVLTFK